MDVTVTNHSGEELTGRYDGQEYTFPNKRAVTVPEQVARHILGYNMDSKDHIVIGLGWSQTKKDMPGALERLSKFRFDPPERTRAALSPGTERVPLNSPKGSDGGKLAIQPATA